jgi:hypothetical protein
VAGAVELRGRERKHSAGVGVVTLLILLALLLLVFKAAFVRADVHVQIAWSSTAAVMALYLARLERLRGSGLQRSVLISLCVVTLGISIARHTRNDHETLGRFLNRNFAAGLLERAQAVAQTMGGRHQAQLARRYEDAMAKIRTDHPLPIASGGVDAMPWDAAAVLASGLPYRPRPVFQSFAAYNETLIRLNRSFVESASAASTIEFAVDPIDNRLAAEDDGALWPELIRHYDAQLFDTGQLLLTRRTNPRGVRLTDIGPDTTTRWNAAVPVPAQAPMVWVTIDVQKNLLGRLLDFLFKLPVIEVNITFADGTSVNKRLIPAIARAGFLLSPVVASTKDFLELQRQHPDVFGPAHRVRSFEVHGSDGDMSRYYHDSIRISFQELRFDSPP